jgi:hypothetical protein
MPVIHRYVLISIDFLTFVAETESFNNLRKNQALAKNHPTGRWKSPYDNFYLCNPTFLSTAYGIFFLGG